MQTKTFSLEYTKTDAVTSAVGVIIVAAGSASRMGGTNKILAPLIGRPVIWHTISAFNDHPLVGDIVVVTRDDMILELQKITDEAGLNKVTDIISGGDCREKSVKNGFDRIIKNQNIKTVLIHDGARPLVTKGVIDRVIAATEEFSAAIPTVPLTDTVKKISTLGRVENTLNRAELAAVQTPQGFSVEAYKAALTKMEEGIQYTDDSSIAEAAGITVYTVLGDAKNIKITTPTDLVLAEAYLKNISEED